MFNNNPNPMPSSQSPEQQPAGMEKEQYLVDHLFDERSAYWRDLYEQKDVFSLIHQRRHVVCVQSFLDLKLPPEAKIIEIGCGAGLTAVALAQRGYTVEATDTVQAMIDMTAQRARDAGVAERVRAQYADVHHLTFADQSVDTLLALGVISWLHDPMLALKEIRRVMKPAGYVIITVNNLYRLSHLLDPLAFPPFRPLKKVVKGILVATGLREKSESAEPHFYPFAKFHSMMVRSGFEPIKEEKFGYGPLTFMNRHFLSDEAGTRLNNRLQRRADAGSLFYKFIAAQCVVVARPTREPKL
jgi:ubiquinone/menaquinone biosynthesis C-methylase UbiE